MTISGISLVERGGTGYEASIAIEEIPRYKHDCDKCKIRG